MIDSDYNAVASQQKQQAICGYGNCPTVPHFDSLPGLAERSELVCDRIQRFIDRIHGNLQAVNAAGIAQLAAVPSGHLGQINRVTRSIDRLEQLASELDAIG